jgi:hypothetical protein
VPDAVVWGGGITVDKFAVGGEVVWGEEEVGGVEEGLEILGAGGLGSGFGGFWYSTGYRVGG